MTEAKKNKEQVKKEKRERFVRLASQRTSKVIDTLRLLEHCANPSGYEFNSQDIDKIFVAINAAVSHARTAFTTPKKTEQSGFTL